MATDVTLDWANGSYNFRLGSDQMIELERLFGEGIPVVHRYLWSQENPTPLDNILALEIIRLGLHGGCGATINGKISLGLEPEETVARYAAPATVDQNWTLARVIVGAAVVGV